MNDLIKLLEEMGATCVQFNSAEDGWSDESIEFTFNGKRAEISGVWFNTQYAGVDAEVSQLGFDESNPAGEDYL